MFFVFLFSSEILIPIFAIFFGVFLVANSKNSTAAVGNIHNVAVVLKCFPYITWDVGELVEDFHFHNEDWVNVFICYPDISLFVRVAL